MSPPPHRNRGQRGQARHESGGMREVCFKVEGNQVENLKIDAGALRHPWPSLPDLSLHFKLVCVLIFGGTRAGEGGGG